MGEYTQEMVEEKLENWGELDFVTDGGASGEFHQGEVEWVNGFLSYEDSDGQTHEIHPSTFETLTEHRGEYNAP